MCEPFNVPLDQVGKLTLWQIHHIYWHRRDKQGRIVFAPKSSGFISEAEIFYDIWRRRGLSDQRIAAKWREKHAV